MEIQCSILWIHIINFSKVGCFRNVQENCTLQTGLKSPHFSSMSIEKEKLPSQFTDCLLTLPTGKKDLVLALCCSSYLALPNEKLWNSLLCFVYLTFNWHKLDLVCFFSLKTISISAQSWALSYLFPHALFLSFFLKLFCPFSATCLELCPDMS